MAGESIERKDPVHFRVERVFQNPLDHSSPFDQWILRITYISGTAAGRRVDYGMTTETLAPYHDAANEAAASQAVYWVSLDYTGARPRPHDGVPDRILRAVANKQTVGTDPGSSGVA